MSRWKITARTDRRRAAHVTGQRHTATRGARPDGTGPTIFSRMVPADPRLWSPTIAEAATEEAGWALVRLAWTTHRPPMWRLRNRHAWRAEGATIRAKRQRALDSLAAGSTG
jgi:hypothetical protein